jgi:MSHA biogenesis protein MshQ
MNLNVSRADYLGSGQAVQGNVCNVGRFYPKDFVIANATVTNRSDIALCASPFTYMDENFTIDFDLQVYNAATPPALTQNYIGAFAKLDPTALGNMNYGATDSGTNYTARLGVSSAGAFTAGVAPVTATLVLAKNAVPDGLYANMAIGIAPADGDGVSLRSLDLSLNGGASSHGKLGQTDIRYGRLNLQNNFGSELLALTLPLSTEYYQATAAEFVTNVDDSCTTRTPANVLLYNDQEAKAGRAVGNPVININGGNSTTLTGITPFVAGQAALTFTAPGVEGYVDVEVQTPSWLQSNIDGIDQGLQGPGMHCNPALAVSDPAYIAGCIADGNSIDETPLSRGNFGIFKGSNNIIYMRETY